MRYYSQSFSRLLLNILLIALAAGAAFGQYPATGNKQRLGFQTTGDGLVYRGAIGDTATIDPVGIANAWMLIDTATGFVYAYRGKRWQLVTAIPYMPFDSVTFNNNEGDADSAELKYNADIGSLIYGGNDGAQIPVLPGHWYVRNDDTITLTKGTVVMATGTMGASGRILAKRMVADGSVNAMYILGIVAKDIPVGEDGYVMWQGKIRKLNTNAYAPGTVLYADWFIPGGLTDFLPAAPNLKLPIAFVVHQSTTSGVIAVRVTAGEYLTQLHDVDVGGVATNDILRYNGSTWVEGKDTSIYDYDAYLKNNRNVLLSNYSITFRDSMNDLDNVQIRDTYVAVRNESDSLTQSLSKFGLFSFQNNNTLQTIIHNYNGGIRLRAHTSATTLPEIDPDFRILPDGKISFRLSAGGSPDSLYAKNSSGYLTATANTLGQKLNISDTTAMLSTYVNFADTASMLSTYLRKADTLSLSNRINTKLNISDTTAMLSSYLRKADTLSLSNRINTKLNISDTTAMLSTYVNFADTASMLSTYLRKADTLSLSNRINTKLNISDTTAMLSTYVNFADTASMLATYINASDTASMLASYLKTETPQQLSAFDAATNAAALDISTQGGIAGEAIIVVDANNATPWDGFAVVGIVLQYQSRVIFTGQGGILVSTAASAYADTVRVAADTAEVLASKVWVQGRGYLVGGDTVSLSNRIDLKLNVSDTASMLASYFKSQDTIFYEKAVGYKWTQQSAGGNNDFWWGATYGNGQFIAVGGGTDVNGFAVDRVMTSPDAINWTIRNTSDTTAIWRDVAYGNGVFVAVASAGTDRVMTSSDGVTWTARTAAGNNDSWWSVAFGNDIFVAVGSGTDRVMTSPDGVTWTARTAAGDNDSWYAIAYGNNQFVAVGSGTDRVMTSPDGVTWTVRTAAQNNAWDGITYGNGLYVAVSETGTDRVMTSPDAVTWTARSTPGDGHSWYEVEYFDGRYIAVSASTDSIMVSENGIDWRLILGVSGHNSNYGIASGNGVVSVVGTVANRVMTSGKSKVSQIIKLDNLIWADSLDFGSVGLGSTELEITVIGAKLSDPVSLGVPNNSISNFANSGFCIYTAYVSDIDKVKIRLTNITSGGANPPKGLFKVIVHKY